MNVYSLINIYYEVSMSIWRENIKDEHLEWVRNVRIVRKQHSVNKITVVVLRAKFKIMSHELWIYELWNYESKIVCVVSSLRQEAV